jgi:molybdenum cofactor cytidylyltransferase
VVLGHEAGAVQAALTLPMQARTVVNRDYRRGQSTSLRAGLRAADRGAEAAVVLLGDQPRMPADVVVRALSAQRASALPVLRTFWRARPGHPVVVARAEWAALEGLAGDAGGRLLWDSSDRVARFDVDAPAPRDVDTWEDYRAVVVDPAASS